MENKKQLTYDRKTGLGKSLRDVWNKKVLYIYLIPAVVFTLVFNYRPMYGIIMAFQKYNMLKGLWGSEFIGFDNFSNFLTSPDFFRALKNTVIYSLLNLCICFPAPIIFAILLNEFSMSRFKKIVQSITYLPHFISWVIVSGLLYKMLDQDTGILNVFLQQFGFQSVGFFREKAYFWSIFIIASLWKEIGWGSILYLSAMTSINPELYEASTVDGAGRLRRIWHITLPGILPTIVMLLILAISGFFSGGGAFEAIYSLRNTMVSQTSDIIDIYSYFTGIRMGNYGYATAIGLAQTLISISILLAVNKTFKKLTDYSIF